MWFRMDDRFHSNAPKLRLGSTSIKPDDLLELLAAGGA